MELSENYRYRTLTDSGNIKDVCDIGVYAISGRMRYAPTNNNKPLNRLNH